MRLHQAISLHVWHTNITQRVEWNQNYCEDFNMLEVVALNILLHIEKLTLHCIQSVTPTGAILDPKHYRLYSI